MASHETNLNKTMIMHERRNSERKCDGEAVQHDISFSTIIVFIYWETVI